MMLPLLPVMQPPTGERRVRGRRRRRDPAARREYRRGADAEIAAPRAGREDGRGARGDRPGARARRIRVLFRTDLRR